MPLDCVSTNILALLSPELSNCDREASEQIVNRQIILKSHVGQCCDFSTQGTFNIKSKKKQEIISHLNTRYPHLFNPVSGSYKTHPLLAEERGYGDCSDRRSGVGRLLVAFDFKRVVSSHKHCLPGLTWMQKKEMLL